ncbi:MAG: CC0125/CC1285 family lipoprotein [Caulobacteraceae bacterium]
MIRNFAFAAAALALAACATTAAPPYSAAASATSAGYSETQIEANRYFVTYRAPSGASAAVLQDYALLRAAELTLQNGRDWFWVDRRTTDEQSSRYGGSSVGVGVGGGSWGRSSGASVGVGLNFPLGGQSGPRARSATLEIRFGQGPKPDDANAYDARSTAANLRARAG